MLSESPLLYPNPSCRMGGASSAFEPFEPLKKKKECGATIKLCDKIRKVFICICGVFRRKNISNRFCRFIPILDKHCTCQITKIHRVGQNR